MSRQDKSISERHTKTLRELVKRPENKVCADCKRNDPRWASWNLGVFLCIRCSGIHRGMGTHISKVKSVDLDVWTPEQMDSIQTWGNGRANLYWEAHLKPGHIPADHKMESFIRSKYESRRWALEGPPPKDPAILENAREHYSEPAPSPPTQPTSTRQPQAATSAQRQSRTLLSSQTQPKPRAAAHVQSQPPAIAPHVGAPAPAPQDDLFSLDFHAPASSSTGPASPGGQKKDVKNDILSLFASTPSPGTGVMGGGGFGAAQSQVPAQPMSMTGNTGWGAQPGWNGSQGGQPSQNGVWGQQQQMGQPAQNSLWGQQQQQQQQQVGLPQSSLWGQQQQQPQQQFGAFSSAPAQPQNSGLFAAQNVWGGGVAPATMGAGTDLFSNTAAPQPAKKDDAFGDLWGGFK